MVFLIDHKGYFPPKKKMTESVHVYFGGIEPPGVSWFFLGGEPPHVPTKGSPLRTTGVYRRFLSHVGEFAAAKEILLQAKSLGMKTRSWLHPPLTFFPPSEIQGLISRLWNPYFWGVLRWGGLVGCQAMHVSEDPSFSLLFIMGIWMNLAWSNQQPYKKKKHFIHYQL